MNGCAVRHVSLRGGAMLISCLGRLEGTLVHLLTGALFKSLLTNLPHYSACNCHEKRFLIGKKYCFSSKKVDCLGKVSHQQKQSLISILNYMNRQPFRVLFKSSFCFDQTVESFLELVKNDDIKDSLISPRNVLCGRKNGLIGTTNIFTLRHLV